MTKQHCVCFIIVYFWFIVVEGSHYRFDYTYSQEAGGWLKFHQVPATFKSAFLRCHAEGAVVASPLNQELQKAMETLHRMNGDSCGIFTGIHAMFSGDDYASVEGVPLSKIPVTWAPHEPDNFNNSEDCTILLQTGTLADVPCNNSFPYICYRKKIDSPIITVCGTVDSAYELDVRTGSCYKFHRTGITWRRAYMTCMAEGGHLAIINSDTESQVIKDLFTKNPSKTIVSTYKEVASIGYVDMGDRSWFTIHGQSLQEAGFTKFAPDQPNNSKIYDNGSYCGGIDRNGLLNDLWCRGALLAFICEKKPDSLNADQLSADLKDNRKYKLIK